MSLKQDLTKWQYYVHVFMIVLGVNIFAYLFGAPFTARMLLYTFIFILLLDIGIHALFTNLPKPYRWKG